MSVLTEPKWFKGYWVISGFALELLLVVSCSSTKAFERANEHPDAGICIMGDGQPYSKYDLVQKVYSKRVTLLNNNI